MSGTRSRTTGSTSIDVGRLPGPTITSTGPILVCPTRRPASWTPSAPCWPAVGVVNGSRSAAWGVTGAPERPWPAWPCWMGSPPTAPSPGCGSTTARGRSRPPCKRPSSWVIRPESEVTPELGEIAGPVEGTDGRPAPAGRGTRAGLVAGVGGLHEAFAAGQGREGPLEADRFLRSEGGSDHGKVAVGRDLLDPGPGPAERGQGGVEAVGRGFDGDADERLADDRSGRRQGLHDHDRGQQPEVGGGGGSPQ